MIVLDTNVISEVLRERPDPAVTAWLAAQPVTSLFLTAVTQAELLYGAALLPEGRRRQALTEALTTILATEFAGRILPFDRPATEAYAQIAATRRASGAPISAFDAQIAGISRSRGAQVATRNVADFDGCGIGVVDPWTYC